MATVEKVKRTRKPKAEKVAKEEHLNIDCITLQNTELELELELEKERENDKQKEPLTSTLETPATKPKKTTAPRKKKEPKYEPE